VVWPNGSAPTGAYASVFAIASCGAAGESRNHAWIGQAELIVGLLSSARRHDSNPTTSSVLAPHLEHEAKHSAQSCAAAAAVGVIAASVHEDDQENMADLPHLAPALMPRGPRPPKPRP